MAGAPVRQESTLFESGQQFNIDALSQRPLFGLCRVRQVWKSRPGAHLRDAYFSPAAFPRPSVLW
jgi:hypothetical protein